MRATNDTREPTITDLANWAEAVGYGEIADLTEAAKDERKLPLLANYIRENFKG